MVYGSMYGYVVMRIYVRVYVCEIYLYLRVCKRGECQFFIVPVLCV